jgi:peptidoglycan hydrolase-like protein with peptidoglycan-binding domain
LPSKSATNHATVKSTKTHKGKRSRKAKRVRGQQKIDSQRARDIQEALIRQHYMTGKPSGVWDDATQKAMQRFQADNGWQSKTSPDARALIKLGLGPDHEHLLNPESAMTGQPVQPRSVSSPSPAAAAIPSTSSPATPAASGPQK